MFVLRSLSSVPLKAKGGKLPGTSQRGFGTSLACILLRNPLHIEGVPLVVLVSRKARALRCRGSCNLLKDGREPRVGALEGSCIR